jgi:predicted ABC-type exoprotein transport system permease subunit
VIASALAVGFLVVPLILRVNRGYFAICSAVLALQVVLGFAGSALHLQADLQATGQNLFDRIVHGAPVFAPLLFPNLAVLAGIGLWVLAWKHSSDNGSIRP